MTREHVSGKFVAIAGLLCSVACSSPNFNDVGSLNGGGTSGSSSGGAAGSTGGNSTGGNSTGGNSTGGNSTGGNSTGGNGGSSVTAGASGGSAADSPILCDGKDALRFAVQSGGGNVSGIPSLVLETGFSFLLIDGRCRYYAMTAPDQEIRTGTLTATDAQNLSVDFLLGRSGVPTQAHNPLPSVMTGQNPRARPRRSPPRSMTGSPACTTPDRPSALMSATA